MALTKATNSMIVGAPVNVLDLGAVGDGTTDDTAAFTSAAAALTNVVASGLQYKITSSITWKVTQSTFNGQGAYIDATGITSGSVFVFQQDAYPNPTNSDYAGIQQNRAKSHPSGYFSMIGALPAAALPSTTAISLSGPYYQGGSISLTNTGVSGFNIGVDLTCTSANASATGTGFTDASFNMMAVQSCNYGFYASASTIASEKIMITDGFIANSGIWGVYMNTPYVELYITNTSISGSGYNGSSMARGGVYSNGNNIEMVNCHLEAITGYYIQAVYGNGLVSFKNGAIFMYPIDSTNAPFYSNAINGGISIDTVQITTSADYYSQDGSAFGPDRICDGGGRFVIKGVNCAQGGYPVPLFTNYYNTFNNYAFANSNLNGWDVTAVGAGNTIAYDGTVGYAVLGSMKVTMGTSNYCTATYTVPCKPGQIAGLQCYYISASRVAAGAAAGISWSITFIDSKNNVISSPSTSYSIGSTTSDGTWRRARIWNINVPASYGYFYPIAPAGTVNVIFTVSVIPGSSGYTVNFDEFYGYTIDQ